MHFFCVGKDTPIITRCGLYAISDVIGQEVEIWNGQQWSKVTPFQTSEASKLYRVTFNDGSFIDATENHIWYVRDRFNSKYTKVTTLELLSVSKYAIHTEPFTIEYENEGVNVGSDWAYTIGVAVGDGSVDKTGQAYIRLYSQKTALEVNGKRHTMQGASIVGEQDYISQLDFTGEFLKRLKNNAEDLGILASWSKECILSFIAGLADTDGSNTASNGIRIYVSKYERAHKLYLLLLKCGIRSSINLMALKGTTTNKGVRSEDMYYLQITDCKNIPCQRLDVSKGTSAKYKGKWQVVNSVVELPGFHPTFCVEEPEQHKVVFNGSLTGNCNLSEVNLNQLDPLQLSQQKEALQTSTLLVGGLLHHKFANPKQQYSREKDPIVAVCLTGITDFFVNALGEQWLLWWKQGRPGNYVSNYALDSKTTRILYLLNLDIDDYLVPEGGLKLGVLFNHIEQAYFSWWKAVVLEQLVEYCKQHNFRLPSRYTAVQPSGTKSLLTGASPGVHFHKGNRFIRRITFRAYDPVALACKDYGYNVIPSSNCKDENGIILTDIEDVRSTEWLVEIPCEIPYADICDKYSINLSEFSFAAQYDFYMNVQRYWCTHNVSVTFEYTKEEIPEVSRLIYEGIKSKNGFVSGAMMARFNDFQSHPLLPFEPISKERYESEINMVLKRQISADFQSLMNQYYTAEQESYSTSCDGQLCELKGI